MKISIAFSLVFVLVLFVATPVYSVGFGLFVNGGKVEASWDGDFQNTDTKGEHLDVGFALDTNLATDRLFNYRMELGKAYWEVDSFNNQGVKSEVDGLVLNQDFGFGGRISDSIRLWLGPELRLTYLNGDLDGAAPTDIDLFGLGFGAAAGINFNFSSRLTLAAKAGYVMTNYYGNGPNWDGGSWQKSDYTIDENLAYLGFSVFFRTKGDQ